MDRKDKENFNIDFKSSKNASDDDTELSFMNFSLSAKRTPPPKDEKLLSELDKMSIFDFTQKEKPAAPDADAEAQEHVIEEVSIEPVSEREIWEETPQEPVKEEAEELLRHAFSPEDLTEYSEEPLPESDEIEIDVVSWGQKPTPPASVQASPKKPIFIDDTASAERERPVPSDDEVEIRFCDFKQSAERRIERQREKQKKN